MRCLMGLPTLFLVASCAGDSIDVCARAADRVAECLGASARRDGDTCDPDTAARVAEMECPEVAALAATGKADGWWDDFLCGLGYGEHCDGAGSPTAPQVRVDFRVEGAAGEPKRFISVYLAGPDHPRTLHWTDSSGRFAVVLTQGRFQLDARQGWNVTSLPVDTTDLDLDGYVELLVPVPW